MANRIKMVQKELMISLFKQKWSDRKINKSIGLHRATISRYRKEWLRIQQEEESSTTTSKDLSSSGNSIANRGQSVPLSENKVPTEGVVHFEVPTDPEMSDKRSVSKSKAALYHDEINLKLQNDQHAVSIYQDLVCERQYSGSYDSIKRYIRRLKNRTPDLYARIETPPGEEAQVDFGQGAPTLHNGRYRKPWLFVMTLANSRKSYQECVWKQDVETFIHCHENAFAFFGGVTRIIKHDNLKSAVLKAHLYEAEMNPNYLAFADHYGFIPIPCKVRTPEHKGKVESNIKYVQNNALKGKRFDSLEEQNRYLGGWNKTWASTRIHGTTKRQVNLMFSEEQPVLKPLPSDPFHFFKIGSRKVSSTDSHIEIVGAYYPVPPQYMGRRVQVHYNSRWIKAFYRGEIIQHLSTIEKGRFHPNRSCLPPNKDWQKGRYLRYLFSRCGCIGSSVLEWAKQAETHRQERAYRSIQGIVALSGKYGFSIINAACQRSIEHNAFSYHLVKQLAESIRIEKQVQKEINFTQESEYIRSPKAYQELISGDDNG
jgi:transposase